MITDKVYDPLRAEKSSAAAVDLALIARTMKAAQDNAHQLEPFTAKFAQFDTDHAYAVASLLHQARLSEGAKPIGRKIGFTNRDMWTRYGVNEPIWAFIYDSTVRTLHDDDICRIARFTEPKIEPEIVLHFRSAPPSGGHIAAILECIDWVAHAFEIVQSHFPGWKFQAADTIADCALHGTLLVGEPRPVQELGDTLIRALETLEIRLYCDGEFREAGRGSNVLGIPLRAVRHMISALARNPSFAALQANEIVTTGTITTAQSIRTGQSWTSQVSGLALPGLSIHFEP